MEVTKLEQLINESESLKSCMNQIEQSSIKVLIVITKELKVVGSISDGDIRRYIIKSNKSIEESKVNDAMNPNPVVIFDDNNAEVKIDEDKKLIPLVNREFVFKNFYKHQESCTKEVPVFIMAGGLGKRLRPYTNKIPKPMLKIADKPLLEHNIIKMKNLGFKEFYLSTHYLPNIIEEHFKDGSDLGVKISYINEETPLGTGGSLSLLPKKLLSKTLLMMNGDVFCNVDFSKLISFHNLTEADITVCTKQMEHYIPYGVIDEKDNQYLSSEEKPTLTYNINTGIYVLNLAELKISKQKIDMPNLVELARNQGKKINVFKTFAYWLDIGTEQDYIKAQHDLLNLDLN